MIEITKDNLKEVLEQNETVIIDFWAPWCGPCRALGPIMDEVSSLSPNVCFGKVNVDEQEELAGAFNVQSIPFVAKFKKGSLVESFVGLKDTNFVKDFFNK